MSKYKYDKYYDDIIKMRKDGKKAKEILKELNDDTLTIQKLYKLFNRLGVSKTSEKTLSKTNEVDKKALELISQGYSHRETARILNIDQQSMTLRLKKKYNIEVLLDGKKNVDSNFFETINTPEKAYWLGMMYSDGYVNKDNGFELCLKDKEHIYKFKKALKSEHKISTKTITVDGKEFTSYRITIKDDKLISDLIKNGCFQAKSYDIKFPTENQVPDKFIKDFIRGFFDGDGDISKTGNKNGYRIAGFTCANEEFLNELANVIKDKLGICVKPEPTRLHYRLRIQSVIESYKFLDYIYKGSKDYLERKYELYQNFILPSYVNATEDIG